jgi:hypothetical protein
MPVIYQKRIFREDLKANPQALYLFDDNDQRTGLGGQAKEMRGEPNAAGIRTKKAPGINDTSYYSDREYSDNVHKINEDLAPMRTALLDRRVVVIPLDGFGTGLAALKEKAPRTFAFLQTRIAEVIKLCDVTRPG